MADSTPDKSATRCPSCDAELAPNAVLCVACGYHLKQRTHLATVAEPSVQPMPDNLNPYQSPAAGTSGDSGFAALVSIFWIEGRIPRWQWWAFQVGYFVALVATGAGASTENRLIPEWMSIPTFWIATWILLVAQVRRWHDIDRSGFWILVNLVPILGPVYSGFELGFERGTVGMNEYGEDPLALRL